jgi:SAM-dependent methyltransferase
MKKRCTDGLNDYSQFAESSRIRQWLRKFLFIKPIVRLFRGYVLDIGCGPGIYLEQYSGPSLGIDAHPNNVKICEKNGIHAIETDANSFVQVNTFDTVLISHVLEHLDNPLGVIENAYRSTKPGGRIIVIVPCSEGYIYGLNDEIGHKQFITEDFVERSMKSFNCKKIHSSTFPPFFGGKFQELRIIFEK